MWKKSKDKIIADAKITNKKTMKMAYALLGLYKSKKDISTERMAQIIAYLQSLDEVYDVIDKINNVYKLGKDEIDF